MPFPKKLVLIEDDNLNDWFTYKKLILDLDTGELTVYARRVKEGKKPIELIHTYHIGHNIWIAELENLASDPCFDLYWIKDLCVGVDLPSRILRKLDAVDISLSEDEENWLEHALTKLPYLKAKRMIFRMKNHPQGNDWKEVPPHMRPDYIVG